MTRDFDRPVTVGFIGAGYISDYHRAALRALPDVELRAICDLRRSAAERFAVAHGVPGVYDDLGEMLAREDLDVVHVLTPPNAHIDPARAALEAGVDVLMEKPLAHTAAGCQELRRAADESGAVLATSHNFLFGSAYEALVRDVESGRLGHIDQIDIVWNKELGQVKGGPFGAWMLQHPSHILFEVAPHSFAHAAHLVGDLTDLSVDARDEVALPRGLRFYRRWEIRGWADAHGGGIAPRRTTSVRIRFGFDAGYPEHYVHVRGSNGTGRVDFEQNTYARQEHTPYLLDIDRFVNASRAALASVGQAGATLGRVVLAKAGLHPHDGPFAASIAGAVERFYATREGDLDARLDVDVAAGALALAERVAERAALPAPRGVAPHQSARDVRPDTLVIGGTGFIGRALVRKLVEDGARVRVLARDPLGAPPELRRPQVELVRGDFTDEASVREALRGVAHVYHLARGFGNTWQEYLRWDVEPTKRLAELCVEAGVTRFFYASSIAIYDAGARGGVITEATAPVPDMLRANPYARSKAENERVLGELAETGGLPLVVFRPGIVLGRGGSPFHWGVAAWPYHSVCRLYGEGDNPLPIVLVDDVADAMVAARHASGVVGQSYNLTAAPCITANEYLDAFEERAGVRLRRVPVSAPRAYLAAMSKWVVKAAGRHPSAVRPSYVDQKGREFAAVFDASKAERELTWSPERRREVLVREGIWAPVDAHFEREPSPALDASAASAPSAARARV